MKARVLPRTRRVGRRGGQRGRGGTRGRNAGLESDTAGTERPPTDPAPEEEKKKKCCLDLTYSKYFFK